MNQHDINQYNEYIEEKNALIAEFTNNGMSEYEAEQMADDMAWNLAYRLSNTT